MVRVAHQLPPSLISQRQLLPRVQGLGLTGSSSGGHGCGIQRGQEWAGRLGRPGGRAGGAAGAGGAGRWRCSPGRGGRRCEARASCLQEVLCQKVVWLVAAAHQAHLVKGGEQGRAGQLAGCCVHGLRCAGQGGAGWVQGGLKVTGIHAPLCQQGWGGAPGATGWGLRVLLHAGGHAARQHREKVALPMHPALSALTSTGTQVVASKGQSPEHSTKVSGKGGAAAGAGESNNKISPSILF